MQWMFLSVVIAASVAAVGLFVYLAALRRKRTAGWENLHERGKLFTSQLAYLAEIATRKGKTGKLDTPRMRAAKETYLCLPVRATLQRKNGSSSPLLTPPPPLPPASPVPVIPLATHRNGSQFPNFVLKNSHEPA